MDRQIFLICLILLLLPQFVYADDVVYKQRYNSQTGRGDWVVDGSNLCLSDGTHCPAAGVASAGGGLNAVQYNQDGTTIGGKEEIFSFNATNIGIGTTNGTTLLDVRGREFVSQNVGIGTTFGNHALSVMAGNVGIGTWNPSAPLTVGADRFQVSNLGNVTYNQFLNGTAATNATIQNTSTASGSQTVLIGSGGDSSNLVLRASSNVAQVDTNIKFNVGNGGTEAARINIDGNLGIGSTAPGTILDVVGTTRTIGFQLPTNPSAGYVLTSDTVGVGTWMPASGGSASAAGGTNAVQYNSGSSTFAGDETKFSFNGTNVGLGTTNGTALLDIRDDDGEDTLDVLTNSGSFHSLKISGAGTVGIGTPFPDNSLSLDVSGSTTVHGGSILLNQTGAANSFEIFDTVSGKGSIFKIQGAVFNNDAYINTNMGIGTSLSPLDGKLVVFNGNVGLGTFHPGAVLDVNGSSRFTDFQLKTNPSTGFVLQTNAVGVGTWVNAGTLAVTATAAPAGGTGAVQYNNAGSTAGDETKFSFNGTNVGINTTTAVKQLQVNAIGSHAFTVDSSGNVGIGTINPRDMFELKKTTGADNVYRVLIGVDSGNATNVGIGTINSVRGVVIGNATQDSQSRKMIVENSNASAGDSIMGTHQSSSGEFATLTSPLSGSSSLAFISNGANVPWIGTAGALGISLKTTNFDRLTIASGGNVGIGTAQIDNQFFLKNNGVAAGSVLVSSSVGQGTWMAASTLPISGGGSGTVNSGTASRAAVYVSAGTTVDSSTKIFDDGTNVGIGTIAPRTAVELGVQVANISGANLGIGSTAPGTKLDIQGTTRTTGFQLNLNPNASYVLQSNTVGVGTWVPSTTLAVTATAAPGGSSPQIQYNSAGSMGGIASGGTDGTNIGIGTVSFLNILNVLGNVGIGTSVVDAYNNQTAVVRQVVIQPNVGIGTWQANNSLIVGNFNGNAPGGGNVGIGTLLPGVALDVNGTTRISNSGDSYFGGNVGIGTTIPMNTLSVQGAVAIGSVAFTGTANPDITGIMVSGNVGIGTTKTTTSALTIMSGNVGIGTWKPEVALSIKGGAITQKVDAANTACTTTCAPWACFAGFDTAVTSVFVACSDASADTCLCSVK